MVISSKYAINEGARRCKYTPIHALILQDPYFTLYSSPQASKHLSTTSFAPVDMHCKFHQKD